MNREEAIETVRKNWPTANYTMLIEALETLLQEPSWIPLKEHPLTKEDFGKWFWVCERCRSVTDKLFYDVYATTWYQWDKGSGFHVTGSQNNNEITHYMRIGDAPPQPDKSTK